MSLAIFSPYGSVPKEAGFLMVLSRYLEKRGYGVVSVRCNGVFSRCGRDELTNRPRTFATCISCMREQGRISAWGEFPTIDLSPYVDGQDCKEHQVRLAQSGSGATAKFMCEGIRVAEILAPRKPTAPVLTVVPDSEPEVAKNDLLLTAQAITACSKLLAAQSFDAVMIPESDDFLVQSMVRVAERRGVKLFRFRWDAENLKMNISGGQYTADFHSHLYFDDIGSMRADVTSWPNEILNHLKDVEEYLGITQQQLSLPIV